MPGMEKGRTLNHSGPSTNGERLTDLRLFHFFSGAIKIARAAMAIYVVSQFGKDERSTAFRRYAIIADCQDTTTKRTSNAANRSPNTGHAFIMKDIVGRQRVIPVGKSICEGGLHTMAILESFFIDIRVIVCASQRYR